MPPTNLQMEEAWINAWDKLYAFAQNRRGVVYLTPDFQTLSEDEAKGWLQQFAYKGFLVDVCEVWFQGKKAIQLQATRAPQSP